jgi:hypothetical protein
MLANSSCDALIGPGNFMRASRLCSEALYISKDESRAAQYVKIEEAYHVININRRDRVESVE